MQWGRVSSSKNILKRLTVDLYTQSNIKSFSLILNFGKGQKRAAVLVSGKHPEVKKPQGQNVQIIKKTFRESLERAEKYLPRQKIPDAKRAFYLAEDLRPGTFKLETEQIIIKFEDRLIKHKESLLQVFR